MSSRIYTKSEDLRSSIAKIIVVLRGAQLLSSWKLVHHWQNILFLVPKLEATTRLRVSADRKHRVFEKIINGTLCPLYCTRIRTVCTETDDDVGWPVLLRHDKWWRNFLHHGLAEYPTSS